MTPTPIAIVGCAHIHTPKFVAMLLARHDVAVSRVWDHDGARASRTAADLGSSVATDVAQVWNDDDIRAVVIGSETVHHRELALAAVAAGKHLFVEKPLAIRSGDAWEMATAIEAADVIFSTGYFLRGQRAHRFLRDEIAAGRFGTITRIEASVAHAGALRGMFDDEWRWMTDSRLAGFGALGDMGTHAVDLILWLLGYPDEPITATAWTHVPDTRPGSVDDLGQAEMAMAGGMLASIAGSWIELGNPLTLRVSGTAAHAAVIDGQLWSRRQDDGATVIVSPTGMPLELDHAFELFLDAIVAGHGPDLVAPAQAARCSTIIETFYEAARSQQWVEVPRQVTS